LYGKHRFIRGAGSFNERRRFAILQHGGLPRRVEPQLPLRGLVSNASIVGSSTLEHPPVNIFEALRESHDRQRGYAENLVKTSGDSVERVEAYKQLKAELQAHETAEERFFYIPLMAHDLGVDLSRHAISEHHEMDEMLETLDETDMSSPAWLATARKLSDKVHHHLKEEEHKFFQMAGKILDDEQKQALADQYVREYEEQLSEA
jgi:hypothetical protein